MRAELSAANDQTADARGLLPTRGPSHRLVVTFPLAAILLVGLALRLILLARGVPALDSDEATLGLMGIHALHGQLFAYFWGQDYMGSVEALLAAPLIALLGPTTLALRLPVILMGLGAVATVYLLGERLYSRRVGLICAALLAVGPPFFDTLGSRTRGGYVETLLIGNLLLLALLSADLAGRLTARRCALLGVLIGLGLWINMLIAPYLLAMGALLWLQRRRELLSHIGLVLLAGIGLGALPAIVYNATHGAPTLANVLGMTVAGGGSHHALTLLTVPQRAVTELTTSLPILAGGFLGGSQAGGYTLGDFQAAARAHPALYAVSLAIVLAAVTLFTAALVQTARILRRLRTSQTDEAKNAEERGRVYGRAALLLVTLSYAAIFCLSSQGDIVATPRYLFPLYAGAPLVVGQAEAVARRLRARFALLAGWRARAALLAVSLAALLAWNLAGALSLTPAQTAARDHGVWISGDDRPLLALLRSHRVRTVISNDYWEGMRLSYESGEDVIVVMVTPEGHPGFNRYRPYVRAGLADPRPAYVELSGTPEAAWRHQALLSGALPGYAETTVGLYSVLVPA
jgi:4-amino-4-deoxy-L-arabinose transferase-like glycosyltransferase